MRPSKYPLEPLSALRDKKADEAMGALATATSDRESANRRRLDSEKSRDAHGAAAEQLRSEEKNALACGDLRAADLARADAWEQRVASEREALSSEVERARAEEACACASEERARAELAARQADAKLVANDRTRWQEAGRKREEAKEDDAASEARRPFKP